MLIIIQFILISLAKPNTVTTGQSYEQKHLQSYYFRVINIQNLFAIIDHFCDSELDNPVYFRFIQLAQNKEFTTEYKVLSLQQILQRELLFDSQWRFNQIITHIQNMQAIIMWIPQTGITNFNDEEVNIRQCLISQALYENSSLLELILLQNSKQQTYIQYCKLIRISNIQSNEFIHVDFNSREISLEVYQSQNIFILSKYKYVDCQDLLGSIDYNFIQYLGFLRINIFLYITHLSQSINCTIINHKIFTTINIFEDFYQINQSIQYTFSNFHFIQIVNTTFSNRVIGLSADKIKINNVTIRLNPQRIQIECHYLEMSNIKMNDDYGLITIKTSDNLQIVINDFKLSDLDVTDEELIKLEFNHLSVELSGLLIQNSHFSHSRFIQFCENTYSSIIFSNFSIRNIIFEHSLFLYSEINKLQVKEGIIFESLFQSSDLFAASVLIIQNVQFAKSSFLKYTGIQNGQNTQIYNESYYNCTFENSFIINTILSPLPDQSSNSWIINGLTLNQIQGISDKYYLIHIALMSDNFQLIIIQNLLINDFVNLQLLLIIGQNVDMKLIQITNLNIDFNNPVIYISAKSLTIENSNFDSLTLKKHHILLSILSNFVIMSQIRLTNVIGGPVDHLIRFQTNNISLNNFIFIDQEELQRKNYYRIYVYSNTTSIINFNVNNSLIQFVFNSQYIVIDKINAKIVGGYKIQLFFIIAQSIIVQNSIFEGIQQILCSEDNTINTQNSRVLFANNSVNYLDQQNIFDSNMLEFKAIAVVSVINNIFFQTGSNNSYFIYINNNLQSYFINNSFSTSAHIMKIFQFNQNSTTLIKTMKLQGLQSYIKNCIEITNGSINIVDAECLNALSVFKLISPTIASLTSIVTQQLVNLVQIIVKTNITIQLTNITIGKMDITDFTSQDLNLITIIGSEFTDILIKGLVISKIQSEIPLISFLQINTLIRSIELTNFVFLKNTGTQNFIFLEDQSSFKINFKISDLIFNNDQYKSLITSSIITEISDSLIFLNSNQSIVTSEQGILKNSEIIHEGDLFERTLNYELFNTTFTLSHSSLLKEIFVSFDYGLSFALNQVLARNSYQVIFQRKKKYIYLPTGQYLNDFYIFDSKALEYQHENLSLLFKSNDQNINACELQLLIGSEVQQKRQFYLTNQLFDDTFLLSTNPGTIVTFQIICLDIKYNTTIQLLFMAKIMNCQIGEVLVENACKPCDVRSQEYSVIRHSILCLSMDPIRMLHVDKGLIFLKEGFWRPFIANDQIESCQQNKSCLGGYAVGNNLCASGYIGAICSECDLFHEINQFRYYKDEWQVCNKCNIGVSSIIGQIFSFIISSIIILISVISYNKLVRENRIMTLFFAIYLKIIRYQYDIVGIYLSFILDYIQNLFNVSRNDVLQLMPFHINIDFVTNTSFSFINMIDCSINQYFDQTYWIYIRLLFVFTSYVYIFQIYVLILIIYIRFTKQKYSYLLISIALFKIYQANILGLFNQLQLLAAPVWYSGFQWIQSYKTLHYDTNIHYSMLQELVLPSLFLITLILPLILSYYIMKSTQFDLSFNYLKYLYKDSAAYQDIIKMVHKFLLISLIYLLQRQQTTRIILLAMAVYFKYIYLQFNQPYYLRKLNVQYLQIQLWFDIQLMINGLIEQTNIQILEYLLTVIFFVILSFIIYKCCIKIVHQILKDHSMLFDKVKEKLNSSLSIKLKLDKESKSRKQAQQTSLKLFAFFQSRSSPLVIQQKKIYRIQIFPCWAIEDTSTVNINFEKSNNPYSIDIHDFRIQFWFRLITNENLMNQKTIFNIDCLIEQLNIKVLQIYIDEQNVMVEANNSESIENQILFSNILQLKNWNKFIIERKQSSITADIRNSLNSTTWLSIIQYTNCSECFAYLTLESAEYRRIQITQLHNSQLLECSRGCFICEQEIENNQCNACDQNKIIRNEMKTCEYQNIYFELLNHSITYQEAIKQNTLVYIELKPQFNLYQIFEITVINNAYNYNGFSFTDCDDLITPQLINQLLNQQIYLIMLSIRFHQKIISLKCNNLPIYIYLVINQMLPSQPALLEYDSVQLQAQRIEINFDNVPPPPNQVLKIVAYRISIKNLYIDQDNTNFSVLIRSFNQVTRLLIENITFSNVSYSQNMFNFFDSDVYAFTEIKSMLIRHSELKQNALIMTFSLNNNHNMTIYNLTIEQSFIIMYKFIIQSVESLMIENILVINTQFEKSILLTDFINLQAFNIQLINCTFIDSAIIDLAPKSGTVGILISHFFIFDTVFQTIVNTKKRCVKLVMMSYWIFEYYLSELGQHSLFLFNRLNRFVMQILNYLVQYLK